MEQWALADHLLLPKLTTDTRYKTLYMYNRIMIMAIAIMNIMIIMIVIMVIMIMMFFFLYQG